jgi:hypothetical protein
LRFWLGIIAVVIVPLILFGLLAIWLDPLTPQSLRDFLSVWGSILGFPITFLGMLLSGLAAYEVKRLSKRYIARERLPNLRKSLGADTEAFLKTANLPLRELLADGVLARLAANLRSIKSHTAGTALKTATAAATTSLRGFKRKTTSDKDAGSAISSNVDGFWVVHGALEELKVEIDNYRRDDRKRQNVQ